MMRYTQEMSMVALGASPKSHMPVSEPANSHQQTGRGGGHEGNIGALRSRLLHCHSIMAVSDSSSNMLEVQACIPARKASSRTPSMANDASQRVSSFTLRILSYGYTFILQRSRKISIEKCKIEEVRGHIIR